MVVYACLSGFGQDQHSPHVFRSPDRGATWTSIAGRPARRPGERPGRGPERPGHPVPGDGRRRLHHPRPGGRLVARSASGMPLQAVFDLTLHQPSRTLVAATHGRSQWKINLGALPVAVGHTAPPARIALSAPAPNPSRGPARLALALPAAATAEVAVFDAAGRHVRTLLSGALGSGSLPLLWDGLDARGRRAGAGVYFVRASASGSAADAETRAGRTDPGERCGRRTGPGRSSRARPHSDRSGRGPEYAWPVATASAAGEIGAAAKIGL